jgi:hypothetical protein
MPETSVSSAGDSIPPAVAAEMWQLIYGWFNDVRPGFTPGTAREPRIKTISLSRIQFDAGLNNSLYKYLTDYKRPGRDKVGGPPPAAALPSLVAILRADYGFQVPEKFEVFFPALL